MAHVNAIGNEYARTLGDLFDATPKAVLAAIAVSALTNGGDHLDEAQTLLATEWRALWAAGIVRQAPPKRYLA